MKSLEDVRTAFSTQLKCETYLKKMRWPHGVTGIFHHISAKYLQAYLDEFSFRFSYRKNEAVMFDMVLRGC